MHRVYVCNVREPDGMTSADYSGLVREHANGDMDFASRKDAERYLRTCGYEQSPDTDCSTDGGTVDYWLCRDDFGQDTSGMDGREVLSLYGEGCEPALYDIEEED